MSPDDARRTVTLLFESWYSSLVRYAYRATGSLAVAEELAQETFMRLYRELRHGRAIEKPKAWTLCVLRHEVGRHIRHHAQTSGRQEPLDVLDNLPAGHFGANERGPEQELEWDEITQLFSVLTKREEEVLLLRMEALKYREIADQLGISAKSVAALLARALRKLQRAAKGNPEKGLGASDVAKNRPETLQ